MHSLRPKVEYRAGKVRLSCKCGARTNWHDAKWKAEMALNDIEEYNRCNPLPYNRKGPEK